MDLKSIAKLGINFVTNQTENYMKFAREISLANWIQLLFQNKEMAKKVNELRPEEKRFQISNSFINLYSFEFKDENNFHLLQKLTLGFPFAEHIIIDLKNFKKKEVDVLKLIQNFSVLENLWISLEWNNDYNLNFNFPNIRVFSLVVGYENFDPIGKLSVECFISNMPHLRTCFLQNVFISDFAIQKLIEYEIVGLFLTDFYSSSNITNLYQLHSLKVIHVDFNYFHYQTDHDFLIKTLLSSFDKQNHTLWELTSSLPSSEIWDIPYENLLNLKQLEKLNFTACIGNWYLFKSLKSFFGVIPLISESCKIHLHILPPLNHYDILTIAYDLISIKTFIVDYATRLEELCPNFTFDTLKV